MSNLKVKYRLKVDVITPRGTVEGFLGFESSGKDETIELRDYISTNFCNLKKLVLVDKDEKHILINQTMLEQSVIFCKVVSYV